MSSRYLGASLALALMSVISVANAASLDGCPSCDVEAKYVQEDTEIDATPFSDFMKNLSASQYAFRLVVNDGPDEVTNIISRAKIGVTSESSDIKSVDFVDRVKFVDNNSRTETTSYPIRIGAAFEATPLIADHGRLTFLAKIKDLRLDRTMIEGDGEEGDYAHPEMTHFTANPVVKVDLKSIYAEETLVWNQRVGDRVYGIMVRAF